MYFGRLGADRSSRTVPAAAPLMHRAPHPKAALPTARSIAPSFLFGNDSLLCASVFRHTEKNLSLPCGEKKNGSPEGARPCPVFPFVPVLPPDGRRAPHRHPKENAFLPCDTRAKTAPRRSRTPSIARYVKCKSAASPQGEAALFVLYPIFTCSCLPALRPQRRP